MNPNGKINPIKKKITVPNRSGLKISLITAICAAKIKIKLKGLSGKIYRIALTAIYVKVMNIVAFKTVALGIRSAFVKNVTSAIPRRIPTKSGRK